MKKSAITKHVAYEVKAFGFGKVLVATVRNYDADENVWWLCSDGVVFSAATSDFVRRVR